MIGRMLKNPRTNAGASMADPSASDFSKATARWISGCRSGSFAWFANLLDRLVRSVVSKSASVGGCAVNLLRGLLLVVFVFLKVVYGLGAHQIRKTSGMFNVAFPE